MTPKGEARTELTDARIDQMAARFNDTTYFKGDGPVIAFSRKDWREFARDIAALAQSRTPEPAPVAWRYNSPIRPAWRFAERKPTWSNGWPAAEGTVIEPLYLASVPSASGDPSSLSKESAALIFHTLQFYANATTYQGERTGGVLQGCPRGPAPTPFELADEAHRVLTKVEVELRACALAETQRSSSGARSDDKEQSGSGGVPEPLTDEQIDEIFNDLWASGIIVSRPCASDERSIARAIERALGAVPRDAPEK